MARHAGIRNGHQAPVYLGRYQPRRRGRRVQPRVLARSVIAACVAGLLMLRLLPDGALAARAMAQTGSACRVVSLIDGDTAMIWCGAKGLERARLVGFDTPEVFSPECASEMRQGRQATAALRRLILNADQVRIVKEGRDRYGRSLIKVWTDGVPVARQMISDGHARAYDGGKRGGWCS